MFCVTLDLRSEAFQRGCYYFAFSTLFILKNLAHLASLLSFPDPQNIFEIFATLFIPKSHWFWRVGDRDDLRSSARV
jgi:hypothetical protein